MKVVVVHLSMTIMVSKDSSNKQDQKGIMKLKKIIIADSTSTVTTVTIVVVTSPTTPVVPTAAHSTAIFASAIPLSL